MIDRLWLNVWMGHSKWSLLKEINTWCSNAVHFYSSKQYNILLSLKNRWRHWGILNQSFPRSQLSSRSVQSQTACLPLLSWRNSILRLGKAWQIRNQEHWTTLVSKPHGNMSFAKKYTYLATFKSKEGKKCLACLDLSWFPTVTPLWRHGMSTA